MEDSEQARWSLRQRLLRQGAVLWRWAWGLLPDSAGATAHAIRIRLSSAGRRLVGEVPPPQRAHPLIPRSAEAWLETHAAPDKADRAAIAAHIAAMPTRPLFSLRLEARGPSGEALAETCRSLLDQCYPHWEMRVRGGGALPSDPRVIRLPEAAGPGLADPPGSWVMALSPGDRLTDTALYHLAAEASARPELAIIYGDESRPEGTRPGAHPWFKPDFDLDRLLGGDLFGHAAAIRADLLPAAPALATAGWYATGLRAAIAAGPDRISHLPVLLVRRPAGAPPPADAAEAVATVLAEQGVAVAVQPLPPPEAGLRRVVWPLPAEPPMVSVIVPTRDRAALVSTCAEGVLRRTDYPALELIIVDNESIEPETQALFDSLRSDRRVRILPAPGPFNYSSLNNQAAAVARGEILLLLNNDIEVIDGGWLRELVSHAVRPDVGAVGAKLLYADGTLQHGGVITGIGGMADHYRLGVPRTDTGYFGSLANTREVAAATGACLALRREAFASVGGLDEARLAVAFNDVDLCLRLRAAGLRILWTPFAELYHMESASRGQDATPEKARRFAGEIAYMRQRWGEVLMRDPFYNRNLELHAAADLLADQPRYEMPWVRYRTSSRGLRVAGR